MNYLIYKKNTTSILISHRIPFLVAILTASQYRKYGASWLLILKATKNGFEKYKKRSSGLKKAKANEQLAMFVKNEIYQQ